MAETTQIRAAPASRIASNLSKLIPPIANQGIATCFAAQRTYSRPTGDALGFVGVAMGVFGFTEIIANLEQRAHREVFTDKVRGLLPSPQQFKDAAPAIARATRRPTACPRRTSVERQSTRRPE